MKIFLSLGPCTQRPWREEDFEWGENDIGRFADLVESSLRQQGKQARSRAVRDSGYRRVGLAISQLGPHLFPLIDSVEKKVIGTPKVPQREVELRCNNYEVHGVIDVLTSMTLGRAKTGNIIKDKIQEACPELAGEYEIILDYKGMQRPNADARYWDQGDWQIQTYAWLRENQPDALPVAAGILIYINELTPADREMQNLKEGYKG